MAEPLCWQVFDVFLPFLVLLRLIMMPMFQSPLWVPTMNKYHWIHHIAWSVTLQRCWKWWSISHLFSGHHFENLSRVYGQRLRSVLYIVGTGSVVTGQWAVTHMAIIHEMEDKGQIPVNTRVPQLQDTPFTITLSPFLLKALYKFKIIRLPEFLQYTGC